MKWTEEQITKLRGMYPDNYNHFIAKQLNRSICAIVNKASKLQLTKSTNFLALEKVRLVEINKRSRFINKTPAWDKGKKHPSKGRSFETQFKKNQKPQNYAPVGTCVVRIDGRGNKALVIKYTDDPNIIARRHWKSVAQYVWGNAYGPLPPKHIIVFKEGMKTLVYEEITVDRLECISRSENGKRNNPNFKNKELGQLYQLKSAIARHINRIQKGTSL